MLLSMHAENGGNKKGPGSLCQLRNKIANYAFEYITWKMLNIYA